MYSIRKIVISATAVVLISVATGIVNADDVTLPKTMVWTSYDLGAAGYVEASAMADALDKKYGTTIRITPSGTAIGRMLPLQTGRASFGFMSNEIHFASEAMFEFGAREWGPQDMRVVFGRPSAVGLVAGADTGLESLYDLKGVKVGFVQANPSTTLNTNTALAFGNLTPDDVEQIVYPSYGSMAKAFIAGEIDVVPAVPTSSFLREAESGRGVSWLGLPNEDSEGWARVNDYASLFSPYQATIGVSISEENPAWLLGYRYPQLSVTADADADVVYNTLKALDQSFELYKDATKVINKWNIEVAGKTPAGAPFHEGAIRYLTEAGVWSDEDEQWNNARIARIAKVQAAWDKAVSLADAESVSAKNWPEFWTSYRTEHLD